MPKIRFNPKALPEDLKVLAGDVRALEILMHMETEEGDFSFTLLGVDLPGLGCLLLFFVSAGDEFKFEVEFIKGATAIELKDGSLALGAPNRV